MRMGQDACPSLKLRYSITVLSMGQPEEAEEKRWEERREEDLPRKSANSSCLYLQLGFCRIKGIEDENGKRNAVGFRQASRRLKREKKRTKRGCCVAAELEKNAERFSWASSFILLSYQPSISPYLHPYTADPAMVSLEDCGWGFEYESVHSPKNALIIWKQFFRKLYK